MKLPEDKVFNNIQRYGNTTAASIPIAFDEALEMNIIGDGSTVLFLGLGSGLTWGAVIVEVRGKDIEIFKIERLKIYVDVAFAQSLIL